MALLLSDKISLEYPIFGTKSQSLKKNIINITTGGKLLRDQKIVVVKALNNINFELKNGDRLGLIGHNGAGKTTLLKVLAGVYEPTQGSLKANGKIASLLDISLGMDADLTGYENIIAKGLMIGMTRKEIAAITPSIIEFTEMGNFLAMPVKTYSAGMNLRLAFAIATSVIPEILLMDEAIATGDASFIEKAHARMAAFVARSEILVIASHSNPIIRQFCNKVLWLEHGSMKALGPVETVLAQYEQSLQ